MAEYRLSPAAERDLESIWKYTLGEWGLEQADRYTEMTAAFQVLAESAKSAPAVGWGPNTSVAPDRQCARLVRDARR
jgi:plasmid stabilization system protein ParE